MSQPMAAAPVTESERLSYSIFTPEDAALLAGLHSDPEGERYLFRDGMLWSEAYAASEIAKWRQTFAERGYSKFKLTRKSDGAFLGRAGFGFDETHGVAELGYTIASAEWGKGYATEAAARLARWFFEEELDDRFIAFAVPENAASVAVLRKIGMREIAPLTVKGIVCASFEMGVERGRNANGRD